jgi:hypothetical protein
MTRPRSTPYTERGIARVQCVYRGCQRKGYASWQACADGRAFRVLCWVHDIALNRLALEWIGDPLVEQKMAAYSAKVIKRVRELGLA